MTSRRFWLVTTMVVLAIAVIGGPAAGAPGGDGAPDCDEIAFNTTNSTFLVGNASQLQCVGDTDPTARYRLVSDIDATETRSWNDGRGFDPIDYFNGTFAGAGTEITNLTIDRETESEVGLFGRTGSDATITNVTLTNATVSGNERVGAIVGTLLGIPAENTTITDARVSDSAIHGNESVGGIVGANGGDVVDARIAATVVDGESNVGGVVGTNYERITRSRAAGTVRVNTETGDVTNDAGGFVGLNVNGLITRSRASVNLEVRAEANDTFLLIGGFAGTNVDNATIEHSWTDTNVRVSGAGDTDRVGGFVGKNNGLAEGEPTDNGSVIRNSTSTGAVTVTNGSGSYQGGFAGKNDGIIIHSTAEGPVRAHRIDHAGGLVGLNRGWITGSHATGSIKVSSGELIGGVAGMNRGLITRSNTTSRITVTKSRSVGGFAGSHYGAIRGSNATGSVETIRTSVVGGFVGTTRGPVNRSHARTPVNSTDSVWTGGFVGAVTESGSVNRSYALGPVDAIDGDTGGFVGLNGGSVQASYSIGPVSFSGDQNRVGGFVGLNNGLVDRTYTVGTVNATDDAKTGGFAGLNSSGSIEASYFDVEGEVASPRSPATPLLQAQMVGENATSNMAGLEFNETWTPITEPAPDYPVFDRQTGLVRGRVSTAANVSLEQNLTLSVDLTAGADSSVRTVALDGNRSTATYRFPDLVSGEYTVSGAVPDSDEWRIQRASGSESTPTVLPGGNVSVDFMIIPAEEGGSVSDPGDGDAGDDDGGSTDTGTGGFGGVPLPSTGSDEAAARFELSTSVRNATVTPGQPIVLEQRLTNVGDAAGTYEAVFQLDGQIVNSTRIDLEPGATETVVLTHSVSESGSYSVGTDRGTVGTVTVAEPPSFEVQSLEVPETVSAGETITATVTARNTGGMAGTRTLSLSRGETILESQALELNASETRTVELTTSVSRSGTIELRVGGDSVETVTVDATEGTDDDGTGSGSVPGFGIVPALAALLGLRIFVRNRS